MSKVADFYTTEEAARRLGVTVRRIQQMLESGEVVRLARGLVDASSLDRHLAMRAGGRTRAWAEHTGWGAIAMLSGVLPTWLGAVQTSRLRVALRETAQPADFIARTRERAVIHTYSGHPTAAARLRDDLVMTDSGALGLGSTVTFSSAGTPGAVDDSFVGPVDGYLAADQLDSTVRFLGLREDASGVITVRATNFDIDVIRDLASCGTVLAALDAATSLDPRERGVGERALVATLDKYGR